MHSIKFRLNILQTILFNCAQLKMSSNTLQVELVDIFAKIPTRAYKSSVGFDIYSCADDAIEPLSHKLIGTGLKLQPPPGTYIRIAGRSGLANNHGIIIGGGVVDTNYLGEIKVILFNLSNKQFRINRGDRICQGICEKFISVDIEEVSKIQIDKDNKRGDKGFGSSGV